MKAYNRLFFFVFIVLVTLCACSDDEREPVEVSNCTLTIPSGSTFTLYTLRYEFLKEVRTNEDKFASGVKTKYLKSGIVFYSFKGLDLDFENYIILNDINFSHKDGTLKWMHSVNGKCGFWGESYSIQLNKKNEIEKIAFKETSGIKYSFGQSIDNFTMNINGSFIITN